jgi:hypothetical protein
MNIDVGTAQRPARGELVCGDVTLVLEGDVVTIALADGLGHGPLAAEAGRGFCDFVAGHPDLPLAELFALADRAISHTRGVAGAVLRLDPGAATLEFAGVGNVAVRAPFARHVAPFSTPGIVGRGFRKSRRFVYPLEAPLLLVLHSDGISSRSELEPHAALGPQAMAEAIVRTCGVAYDDATCIVARCR